MAVNAETLRLLMEAGIEGDTLLKAVASTDGDVNEHFAHLSPREKALAQLAYLGLNTKQIVTIIDMIEEAFGTLSRGRRDTDRERTARRRARMDVSEPEWYGLRNAVFERDGRVCAYCGDEAGPHQVDHVIPVSRGGKSVLDNLVVACGPCNASKCDKLLSEWGGRL